MNFGKDPEIVGGAYNNNFNGATATLFYMVDHDLDTPVTISGKNATGSSNTGSRPCCRPSAPSSMSSATP